MDVIYVRQAFILKEAKQVFKKLISEDPMQSLYMVDFIQRLGIEHHFEEEIESALQKQLTLSSHLNDFVNSHQLYEVALTFRLLRQGGYYVNADVFDSLTSNKRKFREKYGEDVKGLIAQYEATRLSIEGEDSLDDAGNLSSHLLHAWLSTHEDHHEAKYVASSLQHPLHYGLSRFMDRSIFLSDFKAKNEWTFLKELAEINSCIVRFMNQNETIEVSKWWKELGLAKEVKFAKYEPLKWWYMWPMACFTNPRFSDQRIELTKPVSLIYVIDDIFDVYGTLDQLTLFTDAVNRWGLAGTEQLPDFMKMCLAALYDITNDFAEKVYKKHGLNPVDTLKKSWVRLLNAVLEEARWLSSGHLPKAEEYLNNGIVSTGVHVVLVHAFFLFDHEDIKKETVAIMDHDFPNIIYSVAKILRLCDDLEGAKSEDQKGVDGSYLECYMSEHQQVSTEDAQRHVAHLISIEWKRLNREIMMPNPFSSSFTNFCLNAARMVPLMYHYQSSPSLSNLKEHVKYLVNVAAFQF